MEEAKQTNKTHKTTSHHTTKTRIQIILKTEQHHYIILKNPSTIPSLSSSDCEYLQAGEDTEHVPANSLHCNWVLQLLESNTKGRAWYLPVYIFVGKRSFFLKSFWRKRCRNHAYYSGFEKQHLRKWGMCVHRCHNTSSHEETWKEKGYLETVSE